MAEIDPGTLAGFARVELDAAVPAPSRPDDWVAEAMAQVAAPGEYVAYLDGDRAVVFALTHEWTRIGRSLTADIRFDDQTVSRRHALVVRQPDGVRILDDRSLNGVFVNGERIEWHVLADGDDILVGSHHLRFVAVAAVPAGAGAPGLAAS